VAEQGVGLSGASLPVGQDGGADLVVDEEVDSPLEAVLVDVGVVVVLVEHLVEAVGDDGLGPALFDVLGFVGREARWLVVEVGLYPDADSVFGVVLLGLWLRFHNKMLAYAVSCLSCNLCKSDRMVAGKYNKELLNSD